MSTANATGLPVRGAAALARRVLLPAAVGALVLSGTARAQETRAELIASQQAEKAESLAPYVPNAFERTIVEARRRLLEEPGGFFPYFSSVYRGGGFTLGAGYRRYVSEVASWDVKGLYSFKNYKLIETAASTLSLAGTPIRAGARIGWRDAPEVGYYGTGMGTLGEARANFRFREFYAAVTASSRAGPFVLSGGLAYEDYRLSEGQGSEPSIETIYTPSTAPGLGADPAFVHTEATAGYDSRVSPAYARRGGYYGITFHDYADVRGAASFDLLTADAIHHVPILRETWVLSFRGTMTTALDDSDEIPYFMLPSLGSGSTLRAYASGRFRDRHSLLTSAEWRWIPNRRGLDMAIFFDAGKVASERGDLDFDGLRHDWGVGARFHMPLATVLRIDLARGSEGWNLVFSSGAAF